MPSHGRSRRDAGPQGPAARRGLRALAGRGLAAAALVAVAALAAAAPTHARTIVSLEFDVATADQRRALPLLDRHGMRATFFVNSGFVGEPGHLTWRQLRHMQAIGHEIAGQTRTHARLPGLSRRRLRREICGDRQALLARGLAADAFAYPFGAYSGTVRDVVVSCGYTSARLASGIAGAGKVCPRCPYAESIPPRSRFATRMPAAVQRTSTLSRLTRAVRDAQRHGGGWVQILIHHVCNGCHRYAISRRSLARLLRWLDARSGVSVRTVSQLMDVDGPSLQVVPPRRAQRSGTRVTLRIRPQTRHGIRRVRFFVDDRLVGVRNAPPWRLKPFLFGLEPGRHAVRALLEDRRGNAAISPLATFRTR